MNFKLSILRSISIVLSVVGLIVLLMSTNIGMNIAQGILMKQGGMDTEEYRILQTSYIETYRWFGILLLGIGLLYSLRPLGIDENKQLENRKNNDIEN